MALGQRENLRWNKFSSFILTTCSSSAGGTVLREGAFGGGGNSKKQNIEPDQKIEILIDIKF